MSLASGLNRLVTLYRPTQSQGGSGGQSNMFAADPQATRVGCSIQPASMGTQLKYNQRQVIVSHTLYFDQDYKPTLGCYWMLDELQPQGAGRKFVFRGQRNDCEVDDVWESDCWEQEVPLQAGVNAP